MLDAALPPSIYLDLAAERGWRITTVLETHVHADHLSRSRALADHAGARLLIPAQRRVRFPFEPVNDGDEIPFGSAKLKAVRTPGHTEESTCYLLKESALFTGDTLFLDGVGRPDLHAGSGEAREKAALVYRSLRKIAALDPRLLVFPGHSATPIAFDRRAMTASIREVSHRIESWLASEDEFVTRHRMHPPRPGWMRGTFSRESSQSPAPLLNETAKR